MELENFRDAVIHLMSTDPSLTKYRLAKELGMSTPLIINNILSSTTKRPNIKFIRNLNEVYGIKLKGEVYEDAE